MTDIIHYFKGHALYGDDFGPAEIASWFKDEAEGYADLGAKDATNYAYAYHAWNRRLGYDHLPPKRFARVLGFGSAYGDELQPVIDRIDAITIVDPSDAFVRPEVLGKPAAYIKPGATGDLPLPDGGFDLITCLGVLHHIPNVSHVVKELARVLAPGGHLLLREPIISMGDWRHLRRGLTKRERGIPLHLLLAMTQAAGLVLLNKSLCAFPLTPRLFKWWRPDVYNSDAAVMLDSLLSQSFAWNVNYHPAGTLQKLRPTSAFLVLQKPVA